MAVYEALGQLSLNWNRVRPQLRNSDAGQRAVATRFDGLSNAVSKSADAKAKALLAPSLLGQVDELEHVFARRTEIKISAHNAPE